MADSGNNYNYGRDRGSGGRGRGRDRDHPGGRGRSYQNLGNEYVPRGRGSGGGQGRDSYYGNEYVRSQGGRGPRGGSEYYQGDGRNEYLRSQGRGGRGGGEYYHGDGRNEYVRSQGGRGGGEHYQGDGRGRGRGRGRDGYNNQRSVQGSHDSDRNRAVPPQRYQLSSELEPAGRGVLTGKPWGPRSSASPSSSTAQPSPSSSTDQSQEVSLPQSQIQRAPDSSPDPLKLDFQLLDISQQKSLSSPVELESKCVPIRRPDIGTLAIRRVNLLANHFRIKFNPSATIIHYDVDVKLITTQGDQPLKRSHKADLRLIREKLCFDNPNFPISMATDDGEKNIFSAVQLPTGQFKVDLPGSEDRSGSSYMFTIKEVNQLKLSKLKAYISGKLPYIPRDVLQGMDLVIKDNPARNRISVGRSFYSKNYRRKDDLGCGVAAHRGFQQSLKPTSQGLALCLDYSVLAFRKQISVIEFLMENVNGFQGVNDVNKLKPEVERALNGLKVQVTHRKTKQKYTIAGLTDKITRDLEFLLEDPDGQAPPRKTTVVNYFWEKYEKEISNQHIPCLDLGTPKKINYVPMEFCKLIEGQIYPKEYLQKDVAKLLKNISLASPTERKSTISEMVHAKDGPFGDVTKNFEIGVDEDMTSVDGRVIGPPQLMLTQNGNPCRITVDPEKCHWNLVRRSVVEGVKVERWALIDFSFYEPYKYRLDANAFITSLRDRSRNIGMPMEDPVVWLNERMDVFSSVHHIRDILCHVVNAARAKCKGPLQIIVCVMAEKHPGYKYLKWVSETQINVQTQCCLSGCCSFGQDNRQKANRDQYMGNLCLKINTKLGGSNVELNGRLPHFVDEDCVMFIGADVNHPAAKNKTCPSIAAVVGTVNWPAANRYVARIQPQEHRKEKILSFGTICRDLISTFAQLNKTKPNKIVVFRDGVSEGQFDMVLNDELLDLKQAICDDHYQPKITLVVAQKRHQTRLFLPTRSNGSVVANVPPGTVVDTTIVHPFEFDFYLCSHYGSMGTSKPTHYHVLWDENSFTSDGLQKLIYHLCFLYARCTKPVSLVPPVYYADLVAYRGRMYQEVLMDLESPTPSVSTSSANSSLVNSSFASSSSSSINSFNSDYYKLCPDLKDVMFFV